MKNLTKAILVIVLIAIVSSLIYLQIEIQNLTPKSSGTVQTSTPSLAPTSSPTTTVPSATLGPTLAPTIASQTTVVANINATPSYDLPNYTPNSQEYLMVNGTVTNNGPNNAINVALRVTAKEENVEGYAIDMLIPLPIINPILEQNSNTEQIISPPYMHGAITLEPYQNYSIYAQIIPLDYNGRNTIYDINITAVWSWEETDKLSMDHVNGINGRPFPSITVPEFSTFIILPLFAVVILLSIVIIRKRIPKN